MDATPAEGRPRQGPAAAALVLALAVLGLHLAAAHRLGRTGVLHQWDVLFSADPAVYTTSFATGANTFTWGGRSFVHPNISNVIYPLVSLAAAAIHAVRPAVSAAAAARLLAALVCPLASAATAAVLLAACTEFGLGLFDAVLLVLIYVASFSGLVFGSIPESYCLSALVFAVLFRTTIRAVRDPTSASAGGARWVAIGTLLASITITNLIPFGLVAALVRRRQASRSAALAWAAGVGAIAFAITIVAYLVGARLAPQALPFTPTASGQVKERHGFDAAQSFVEFPIALANTIAPPAPIRGPGDEPRQTMQFSLSYDAPPGRIPGQWWRAVLVLAVLATGGACAWWLAPWQRAVVGAAAAVVAFNWLLHTFYGTEYFLYSQHWEVPLLVLLATLVAIPDPRRRLGRGLLALGLVLCIWNSVVVWRDTLRILDASADSSTGR
jgi:hypothetical protein